MVKILAFSGSGRKESYNQKLVKLAALGAQQAGAQVTVVNLLDYPMPIINQDLEQTEGMPSEARAFKSLLIEHDGFLIASPEYNSAFSPLLKNAIDWCSRKEKDDEPPLLAYRGKTAVIMAASTGSLGGLRGLVFLRMLLGNLGITVLPNQLAIMYADKAFDMEGNLTDASKQNEVFNLGKLLSSNLLKLSVG